MQLFRRSPMKLLDRLQKRRRGRRVPQEVYDGNPTASDPFEYISNQALEEALIEELQNGPNVSLVAIGSCLSQHVNPNIPDRSNSSNRPLHYAAKHGNTKLIAMLLDAGANIDQVNALGQTPLMIACQFNFRRHFACAGLLISRACNMELRDKGGSNALEQAITASNVACVKSLLDHHAQLACVRGDRGVNISSRSTLFEQPDEYSILTLAESIRARSVGMEIEDANTLFAELEASGGPSFLDRIRREWLCSPSHIIANIIKERCSPFSKRNGKSELGFVRRLQLFVKYSIERGGNPIRESSDQDEGTNSGRKRQTSKKKRALHVRKAQSHEIGDEEEGFRCGINSDDRKGDRRKQEKDARSRKTTTSRRTSNGHRSSLNGTSNSNAGRRSRRPNGRHRRRRKEHDRIRRKRQTSAKTRSMVRT